MPEFFGENAWKQRGLGREFSKMITGMPEYLLGLPAVLYLLAGMQTVSLVRRVAASRLMPPQRVPTAARPQPLVKMIENSRLYVLHLYNGIVYFHCKYTMPLYSKIMKPKTIQRCLSLPSRSFFVFGPRGTGKSTWLNQVLPNLPRFDLLDSSVYLELSSGPHRLESLIGKRPANSWIVLDEIQKVPPLLNEVHRLMESKRWRFALCGSSARKLKRGGANLLAGRAITVNMEGFVSAELDDDFDIEFSTEFGTLPFVQTDRDNAAEILSAYVTTYLKEEIREEGLVRNVAPFVRFLSVAGQLNGQIVNGHNISREAAVPRMTVDAYFAILEDTLLAHFLPAWKPGLKVREIARPKFYWFDAGVARAAAGLLHDSTDRSWLGTALETLIYHELRVYNEVSRKLRLISYYRTPAGVEIDFIIETKKKQSRSKPHIVAIEVKLAEKWDQSWNKPMLDMQSQEGVVVDKMVGVYSGSRSYAFGDVEVMPIRVFLDALHKGRIF
jgi:predicted AAA+ superfamily ATPase